jgi:hypothetical protein
MWRRSLAWIGLRPADNPANDADDGKYAEAHGDIVTGMEHEVKFIMF